MPDFLAEDNICGQIVLQLVSRGNAIIAELLRLKDYIPKVYLLSTKEEVQKYGDIIMDFSYFKIEETQNYKIESSESLSDLDQEFRDNHIELINRFYLVFESIHTYVSDLNHFLGELEEGYHLHQSLEIIFNDIEGKQLMCEALYLFGLMLLTLDTYIEGTVRERILVSYYRYTPQRSDTQSRIDDVCKLLRGTNYSRKNGKQPLNYPEDYFKRIIFKTNYIDLVIGHLRSDDIYGQLTVYPLPKHRSMALANQAQMLYICLFFDTSILHSQTAIMREIVDKYFPDNWIVSIYMGFVVNLVDSWDHFKAAKLALNNTIDTLNVKGYAMNTGGNVGKLLQATYALLNNSINSDNLLNDINKVVNLLRDCNFTIRWVMLHGDNLTVSRNKKVKQLNDLVIAESKFDKIQLFKLLLNTAQLELITRETYKELLSSKESQWTTLKDEASTSLKELSEVFGGEKPLSRVAKNKNLEQWFLEIMRQVDSLQPEDVNTTRKIIHLIQALEEVQEFHQLSTNMQIVQYLTDTRKYLNQMIRNIKIDENVLITLQIIGDLSYAWELIETFTPLMQSGIKKEPTLVIKLRAIFLKLSSVLETPLLRINQAHSEDLISVSQYYSSELEIYVRKVLQIIPKMMFDKLARIIEIQTSIIKELPTRLDKDKLKLYSQLNERFEFAELTHSISVFSQGMRMMKSTLVGVICLDPKEILEDGIRKELVQYISRTLNDLLVFSPKARVDELHLKLGQVVQIMDGYKRSFEYIQDYLNINGLKIWQEEITRIINYYVEQECNLFLRNKVHSWESVYQNKHVPIPLYNGSNFIGRLAKEIVRLTNPRASLYIDQSWYCPKTRKLIFNKEFVAQLSSAIEISGLVGLDRLFSFMIVSNLQKIASILTQGNKSWQNILESITTEMDGYNGNNPMKFYQNCVNRTTKIWNDFLDLLLTVGQLQLLRNLIGFHLNKSCKFNARNLESSLRLLNSALLLDIKSGSFTPSEQVMSNLSLYFDYSGLNNPFNKIYVTSKFDPSYSTTLFIFVIAHLNKLFLVANSNIARKSSDQVMDGTAFAVSVHTLIKQFNVKLNEDFMGLMADYVIQITKWNGINKNVDLPLEVALTLNFLQTYTNYSEISQRYLKEKIPSEILHLQETLVAPITS